MSPEYTLLGSTVNPSGDGGGSRRYIIVGMRRRLLPLVLAAAALTACGRFGNQTSSSSNMRAVVISQVYTEIIWALGAQNAVVGVDYSSTWPPDVKKVTT